MVGWFAVPSCPIATGVPGALLTIRTATAPASCALRIFVEKVQEPREINAIIPGRLPAGSVEQPRPRLLPSNTTPNGAVRSAVTVAKLPASAPNVLPPTMTGEPMKCPTELAPAVRARAADPGDSM